MQAHDTNGDGPNINHSGSFGDVQAAVLVKSRNLAIAASALDALSDDEFCKVVSDAVRRRPFWVASTVMAQVAK